MPTDEAALERVDYPQDAYYYRHLAGEIVAMLLYTPDAADEVLKVVHEMLNVRVRLASEPAASSAPPGADATA